MINPKRQSHRQHAQHQHHGKCARTNFGERHHGNVHHDHRPPRRLGSFGDRDCGGSKIVGSGAPYRPHEYLSDSCHRARHTGRPCHLMDAQARPRHFAALPLARWTSFHAEAVVEQAHAGRLASSCTDTVAVSVYGNSPGPSAQVIGWRSRPLSREPAVWRVHAARSDGLIPGAGGDHGVSLRAWTDVAPPRDGTCAVRTVTQRH